MRRESAPCATASRSACPKIEAMAQLRRASGRIAKIDDSMVIASRGDSMLPARTAYRC
jgi:hypothetical protein